jgi:thiamine kinase-like enzyme
LSVPEQYWHDTNVSELLGGLAPTTNDLSKIVDFLVSVQSCRRAFVQELLAPAHSWLNAVDEQNRDGYKQRLTDSLNGLAGLLTVDHQAILSAFDARFRHPLDFGELTFTHGDFSFGNIRIVENRIALFDFEHSHIGVGCTDLAHLYVNLIADSNQNAARSLLDPYHRKANQKSVWFATNVFEALVLERAAGKMNSMKDKTGAHFRRLEGLLGRIVCTSGI